MDETPAAYVLRVAREKAEAIAARHPERVVVGADTEVVVDGAVLGKPADGHDAARMLHLLSGRSHEVLTGIAVVASGQTHAAVERTVVWMRPLTTGDISAYIAGGEPTGKAGAYAIQGGAARFIDRIEGRHDNVVGLPVPLLRRLLEEAAACRP